MRLKAFFKLFQAWDRPAQIGFALAIGLFIPALIFAAFAPTELRALAIGSVMALVIVAQLVFMWANRGMVTPYTQAQRHYLEGDFDSARELLEGLRTSGKANIHALTLLGNTYRQLGLLADSKTILCEALNIQPDLHFPLYGFGRTLLSEGQYEEAAEFINRALQNGAPIIIRFDLGEAFYRKGSMADASEALHAVASWVKDEPHRALMTAYMLYRMGEAQPPSQEVILDGLAYWQTSAERFKHTPYGKALHEDIHFISALM